MLSSELKKARNILHQTKIKECQRLLRILCGRVRFQIVLLLSQRKRGYTVTELSRVISASHSLTSYQLGLLRRHKLVKGRGMNREVVYTLVNGHIRRHLC